MEEKKVGTLFEEMKDDLADYVSDRLRLFKLQTYAKTSKSGAALIYTIVAILLILFALNFVFIGRHVIKMLITLGYHWI